MYTFLKGVSVRIFPLATEFMAQPPAMQSRVRIEGIGDGRTRMSIESVFPNLAAMEQVLAMGLEEGLTQAVGQIDAILAEDAAVRT